MDTMYVNRRYRAAKGLEEIPFSAIMQFVAEHHTADLINAPSQSPFTKCNAHSWFGGPFSCCYNNTSEGYPCMWDKPRQLASYDSAGFEIIAMGSGQLSKALSSALQQWSLSPEHNAIILNLSPWNSQPWKALGCSMRLIPYPKPTSSGGYWYASCWFGFDLQ